MSATTTFSFTEEAFLLSSLHEVVKVWAQGNGQASFALTINEGVADLNLSFQLGHPASQHCDPPPPKPELCPHHNDHGQQDDQDHHRHHHRRRHKKGPAHLNRNHLRAAKYKQKETNYPAIKLPFSGKLLTVNAGETSHEETTSEDNARKSVSAATPQFYLTFNKIVYAVPPATPYQHQPRFP